MNRDEIIEQAARVLSTHETFTGKPHPRDHHRRQARALADAGLLAQPHPDPEPDWLDAPAVLAAMNECSWQKVWLPKPNGNWECTCCGVARHWTKMTDVTPLYPKEGQEA